MHTGRISLSRWIGVMVAVAAALTLGPVAAGTSHAGAAPAPHTALTGVRGNFWLFTPSGAVEPYGVPSYGSPTGPLNRPLVSAVSDHALTGYWLVASDGGVFAYGSAGYHGSTGNLVLNQPIVGLAQTPDDRGYWLVASDGGVFSFGDASFYGSTGSLVLNQPIVAMTATADGRGYWLVASDGGVFAFGDAGFYGSTGNLTLRQPIVGLARTDNGHGYWMVARDGGVFAFGNAGFYGSAVGSAWEPVRKVVPASGDAGYWIVQQNGTAQAFGSATGQTLAPETLLFEPLTPGDQAVLFAFQQLGKPYIWGGNGPVGYDCSGLALASWVHGVGVSFARVADDQYHTAGAQITFDQLEAGDLVFWGTNSADWTTVYHTAIYVGGGRIVEATGDQVQLNTLDQWSMSQVMPYARRP
jgi:cell wall-associated NlpC family hydrolase